MSNDQVSEINFDEHGQVVTRNKKQRAQAEPTLIADLDTGNEILRDLVGKFHHHLAAANIRLLCTNKDLKAGGRPRPGKVSKTTPLLKFLCRDEETGDEPDILILVSLPIWNEADHAGRTAILDHLLSMVEGAEDETTGAMKLNIVGPQVQEFAHVVERRGLYNNDIQDLANVVNGL